MTSGYHLEVQRHYEKYPYPSYPLFLLGSWGALGSVNCSEWGAKVPIKDIWIAGCGTIAPLMFGRRNYYADILATDLSSAALRACSKRLKLFGVRNVALKAEDIYDARYENAFDAVDAYGVIHHTVSPQKSLETLVRALRVGGALRFMVYSAHARSEIEAIRKQAVEANMKSIEDLRALINAGGISAEGDLSHTSGIADALLNPMVHTFTKESLDALLSSVPQLKILKIEDQNNYVVTAIKI